MIASCPVHGNLASPHLLKAGARCLTLHPLLKLGELIRSRGSLINHLRVWGDAAVQTPPQPTGGIAICDQQTQVSPGVASSSQVAPAWKPKFLLDGQPLPSTTCVRMWEKGEGGRIAQSLVEGLLLPEDVHTFEEGSEEFVGRWLEWHAIAVTL